MTDLKQKLEAAARREAESFGHKNYNEQSHNRDFINCSESYYIGCSSRHPQIIKLVEALEKCKQANERGGIFLETGYVLSREALTIIEDQALAEFHAALEEKNEKT